MGGPYLAIFFLGSLALTAKAAEIRDWTSSDGRKLRAEFVSQDAEKVTIRRFTDGRQFTLELNKLSKADQKWVQKHGIAQESESSEKLNTTKNPYHKLITGAWERHEDHGLQYRVFAERRLRRKAGTTYPLVICLHGKDGDVMTPETPWPANSFAQKANYSNRRCFIVAPQAPKDEHWSGKNTKSVVEIVEGMMKHLQIDPNRIYLTGYSMGGYGTFALLGREPKMFAAAVPVAGGGNPSQAKSYRKVPIWAFHGAQDPIVSVEESQKMVVALEKAHSDVKYTEYPDGDHDIGAQVYTDQQMHEWMFAQVKTK
jgi:predicted peptidase